MLTRIYGKIVFECDDCGDTFETAETAFIDAQEKLKQENWKVKVTNTKNGAQWKHYCEYCSKRK